MVLGDPPEDPFGCLAVLCMIAAFWIVVGIIYLTWRSGVVI